MSIIRRGENTSPVNKKKIKVKKVHVARGTKRVNRSIGGNRFAFIMMFLIGAFMALPLVLVVSNAFKPIGELFKYPPEFFVRHPTLNNFRDLFSIMSSSWVPFTRYFFNTIFTTVVGTAGQVIFASMCAYAMAKHKFPGRNLMFSAVVLSLMFSPAITAVTNYITMNKLGLIDTYGAVIFPAIQSSLGLYLLKQFMEQMVPDTLLEAARIDGATEWYIYMRIVMPIVKPAWLTLIILSVQSLWNSTSPFIYSESLKTLPLALSQIMATGIARAGAGSAVGLFMLVVPLAAFIISQSQIIETMSTSGMKE